MPKKLEFTDRQIEILKFALNQELSREIANETSMILLHGAQNINKETKDNHDNYKGELLYIEEMLYS